MFHENMCFILESREDAKALGELLSEEGIRWYEGEDPAEVQFFRPDCTFWFISKVVTYMHTYEHTREYCLNYARDYGYEQPIRFCEWSPATVCCAPDNIDDLI